MGHGVYLGARVYGLGYRVYLEELCRTATQVYTNICVFRIMEGYIGCTVWGVNGEVSDQGLGIWSRETALG